MNGRRAASASREDIRDLFVSALLLRLRGRRPHERQRPSTPGVNPFGARLKAIFSSDIGHWDVPDMTEVLEEAYEMVEHGTD